jgi:hypothetical protein
VQAVILAIGIVVSELGRQHGLFEGSSLLLDILGAMSTLAFPVVGLVIVARRPGNIIGWLFVLADLGWTVSNAATAFVEYSKAVTPQTSAALATWLATWPGTLSLAAYILVVLLFPDGRPYAPRWHRFAWFVVTYCVVDAIMSALGSGPIQSLHLDGLTVENPLALGGAIGAAFGGLASGPLQLGLLLLFAISAVSLVLRLRRSHGLEHEQLKWLTWAVALTAGLWLSSLPLMIAYSDLTQAPAWARTWNVVVTNCELIIPVAAGIAILRYRLFDIDRIVSRTLSYAIVTGLLAAVFAGLVLALQEALASLTGASTLAVAGSTLVVFALFQPLRRRVQHVVDRRFDRARYDAERTVAALTARLRDETDLQQVGEEIETAVRDALSPSLVVVWLRAVGER